MRLVCVWLDPHAPLADNDVGTMPELYRANLDAWAARYGGTVSTMNGLQSSRVVEEAAGLVGATGLVAAYQAWAAGGEWIKARVATRECVCPRRCVYRH